MIYSTLTKASVLTSSLLFSTSAIHAQESSLQEQLMKKAAESNLPPEVKAKMEAHLKSLEDAKLTKKALQIGDKAPDFSLKDHQDNEQKLSQYLAQGPVVLTWYRGGWWPYCNIALRAMAKQKDQFDALGATIVALTPEAPDYSANTVKENKVPFPVLTDQDLKVAEKYNLVFDLTFLTELYEGFAKLSEKNGEAAKTKLPLSATYIIDTEGIIRYAFLDVDYKKRAEPSEIIAELKKLAPQ